MSINVHRYLIHYKYMFGELTFWEVDILGRHLDIMEVIQLYI